MPYPKYFVSYTVMDQEAGANPFHHACLTLSKQASADPKVTVETAYGFYSQPSKSNWFWTMIGITFKLQDSHGVLKKEELRELNGLGLTAKHFETSKKNYDAIRAKLEKQLENEEIAIAEHKKALGPNAQPEDVYQRELKLNGAKSRLQRFEVRLGFDHKKWFHTCDSYTCKTQSLDTLEEHGLLKREKKRSKSVSELPKLTHKAHLPTRKKAKSDSELVRPYCKIDSNSFGFAFPRTSDETLDNLYLFSDGPLLRHESKRTGLVSFYRAWGEDTHLFFALSPNLKHPQLETIKKGLLALKKCDIRLCKPKNDIEIAKLHAAQPALLELYKAYAALSLKTPSKDITALLAKSQTFTETYSPLPNEMISPSFLLLSWESTYKLSLSLSVLTLVIALSLLSSSLTLTAIASTSTVIALTSCYGLFSAPSPLNTKPANVDNLKKTVPSVSKDLNTEVDSSNNNEDACALYF